VLVGPTDPNHWCPWDAPTVVLRGPVRPVRRWGWPRTAAPSAAPPPGGYGVKLPAGLRGNSTSGLRWEPGEAAMDSIPVAAVWDAALGLLDAPAASTPRLRAAG